MPTYTIYGDAADGLTQYTDASWANARGGIGSSFVDTTGANIGVGSRYDGADYFCSQGHIAFDTSSIGDTEEVSSVELSVFGAFLLSTTDYTVQVREHDWGTTVTSADFVAGASLSGKTLVAQKALSGLSGSAYASFTSEAAFLTAINKTGFTRLVLCDTLALNNTTPVDESRVTVKSADTAGTSNDPKLVVEAALAITLDHGAFTLTGQAAGLTAQRKLTAEAGIFTLSGQTAGLTAARLLSADHGVFTLTGQDADLGFGYSVALDHGAFTLMGQTATLTAQRLLALDHGDFTLSGQTATLTRALIMAAAQASFALSGQDAALKRALVMAAGAGSFVLTGQDAALNRGFYLALAHATFALTGQDAGLLAARYLEAEYGAFALSGQDMTPSVARYLALAHGSFALSGQAADLLAARYLAMAYASFVLTGQATDLTPVYLAPSFRRLAIGARDRIIVGSPNRTRIVEGS